MLAAVAEAARAIMSEAKQPSDEQQEIPSVTALHRNNTYYAMATRNAEFILKSLKSDGKLKRSWREGKVTNEVFLEDYAALILGLIELYQTDFDNKWFTAAKGLANEMIELFNDPNGGFFDTSKDNQGLLLRPKDLQDNATPSGNALACEALLKMAAFTDNGKYRDLAERSLGLVAGMAVQYPTAFSRWLSAADFALGNVKQIAVVYESDEDHAQELIRLIEFAYRPNMIVAASPYPPPSDAPPLLMDRPLKDGKATVYVCEGFVCKYPVTANSELEELL
jgi:uncharacterized protein YyaL (SSP411 family)